MTKADTTLMNKSDKKRLPAVQVDLSGDMAQELHYPLTPASKAASMARMSEQRGVTGLKWDADAIRSVDALTGIYVSLPISCLGRVGGDDICPYSVHCPMSEDAVEHEYKGENCPVETLEAFKIFAGYVIDLEIQPSDYADLMMVVDLVRLHLQLRRTDLYQKELGLHEKKVGGIHQATGTVHYDKVPNLGYGMARQIRQDMDLRLKQLVATRLEKVKRDIVLGKDEQSLARLITKLKSMQGSEPATRGRRKKVEAIDAEYTVKGDETER